MQKTKFIPYGHRVIVRVRDDGHKAITCTCGWYRESITGNGKKMVWHIPQVLDNNIIWLWFHGHIDAILSESIEIEYVNDSSDPE